MRFNSMSEPHPTIEACFAFYLEYSKRSAKSTSAAIEADDRLAFFCGFEACLLAVERLAEIGDRNEDEGEQAWQQLQAEFERFAQSIDCGVLSINH